MSVTRNTLSLLIGSIAQKAIAFVYFALIARWAGVSDTGKYFFAISWSLIFSVVTDLGLTPVLIRESAKDNSKAERVLSQVISMKLPLMALAAIGAVVGVWLMGYPAQTREMVALVAIVLMLDAVSLTFYGTLRGHHMLKYEALGLAVGQSITLLIGVTVLKMHAPLVFLMFALIGGSLYNALASVTIVRRKLGLKPKLVWDKPFMIQLARAAVPFALAGAFVKVYTSADIVMLNKLKGDVAAGLYSVPYKLTFAFQFIPMAFTAALYPAMSRDYVADRARLGELFFKALWYLSLIVAPVIAGIFALSGDLIRFVYGPAYLAAAVPLQILILTLFWIFLDFPVGSILNASDRQTTQTKLMGAATLVSLILNLILIPTLGVTGVVIASFVSHGVLFISGLVIVNRFLDWPFKRLLAVWLKVLAAAVGMGLLVWSARHALPLIASIVLGGACYPLLVLAFGALSLSDARDLINTVLKRKTV